MDTLEDTPTRVIIRVHVNDIPGSPGRRHFTLGDAYCQQYFSRTFSEELKLPRYDHVHIPGDIDSDLPIKRWVIYDLNVEEEIDREQLSSVSHLCYFASLQGEKLYGVVPYLLQSDADANLKRVFISKPDVVPVAKARAARYVWGGRQEQKIMALQREQAGQSGTDETV